MSFTVVIVVVVAVDPVIDVGHCVEDSECHSSEPEIFPDNSQRRGRRVSLTSAAPAGRAWPPQRAGSLTELLHPEEGREQQGPLPW